MPSKKALLTEDIEMRWKILILLKETLKFAAYFSKPETELERNYINRHRHLIFIGWSLWRLTIIELCKLFSDSNSQKFNIIKLLRKIDYDGDYRSLKFEKEKLKEYFQRVEKLQPAIEEITHLRNTLYAHTDSDPFPKIEISVSLEDCYALVEFAEEVIRTLAGTYLNTDYIANTLYFDSRTFDFIHILAEKEFDEHKLIAEQNGMTYKELFGGEPLY